MNRGQRGTPPLSIAITRMQPGNPPRSPNRNNSPGKSNQELGLTLQRVIGTTCQSVTCFDCLPEARLFAYTAGAAAVVATVDEHLPQAISQRFYRANPVQTAAATRILFSNALARDSPDARFKGALQAREVNSSYSPRPAIEWSDSPTSKQGHVKERVKAATTLSFSPNGKYLAVGETGYKPRVLIFSLDERAPEDLPLAVIPEHTFGVQAVAFSPDSKHLASLGTVNDGFLYIWSIDDKTGSATLVASNKCSNLIKQMAWSGQILITVGLRFIKIWRPHEDPLTSSGTLDHKLVRGHKPLAGRNALLGELLEATFTCVVPISEDKAFVCSDGGDICLLDDSERNQRLIRVATVDFGVTSACLDSQSRLLVTGLNGKIKTFDITQLQRTTLPASTPPGSTSSERSSLTRTNHFVAMGTIGDIGITVDNHHGVQLRRLSDLASGNFQDTIHNVPAHSDAVLGVRAHQSPNASNSAFLTWSAGGTVIYWSAACEMTASFNVPMSQSVDMYNIANELKSVTSSAVSPITISGDRYGMLR